MSAITERVCSELHNIIIISSDLEICCLPGWRKINFITVTHRPHHPSIAAGLYCLITSSGFLTFELF